jgi:hypothetical protein
MIKSIEKLLISFGISLLILISFSQAFGQVTFTPDELRQLAEQNLERKECLELRELDQQEIDSLSHKCNLMTQQISFQDSIISNYTLIALNFNRIDQVQNQQIDMLKADRDEQKKIIKKQNRKLTFWRIFTPTAITGLALLGILTK